MNLKHIKKTGSTLEITGILVMILGACLPVYPLNMILGIIGLCIVAGAFLYLLDKWKCPKCFHILPIDRLTSITHCPYCGTSLMDDAPKE